MSFTDIKGFLDHGVVDVGTRRVSPVYGMNFIATNADPLTYLTTVPVNINSVVYPHLGFSAEINIPTNYLAGRLAFSEIYLEDGGLEL